ncbi:SAUR-like auxin-responsive protein family [Euphorbia peplus]|nr:SAUR-like auxin-responsive protein family [Euphorbia peplus]
MKAESIRSLMMLKLLIRKLHRSLFLSSSNGVSIQLEEEEMRAAKMVPGDVKQGHFAVNAMKDDGEPTRFIVELDCLNDPAFMDLLVEAEEEYGFQQAGVLAVPCRAHELETILGHGRRRRMSAEW